MRNPEGMFGLVFIMCLLLTAIFAQHLAPRDPFRQILGDRLSAPSLTYLLGTDHLGRDVLSRIVWGSRVSLQVGLVAVGIALLVGGGAGITAGFFRGWLDELLMRLVEVLQAFPTILLALAVVAALGPSTTNVMIAIGLAQSPNFARLARAMTMTVRQLDFVEAARSLGASPARIMINHVLANIASPLIVIATLGMGTAILSEATLSFLGLGTQPPNPSWGLMLSDARTHLRTVPWPSIFPGVAILFTVLALNLLGDAFRDALDPRSSDQHS